MRYENIAVTGGNGAVGQAIVRGLAGDAAVTSLDVRPGPPGIRSRYTDILSLEGLRDALKGHDAVVHAAALLLPRDPVDQMFQVNVVGTWNVCQVASELGIRKLVLLSSECASGVINISGMRQPCPDYLPIDEDHPLRPLETYGMTKQLAETAAQSFARRGEMQVVALRPTLIVMPGMGMAIAKMHETDDPDLWSYVEIRDVVQAARLALGYEGPAFDAFYLSARNTYASEPTLAFMARKFDRVPEIRRPDLYERNPHAAIWDLSRSETLLGFRPESDWRRFLAEEKDRVIGDADG